MNKAEDYSHKLQNVSAEKIVKLLNEYFVKENRAVKSKDNKESILCKNLIDDFKIGIHFRQVISHKKFINRVWEKLRQHFPNVTHDQILQHDASKIASLTEILGYTDRWVWNRESQHWEDAKAHHFKMVDCTIKNFGKEV